MLLRVQVGRVKGPRVPTRVGVHAASVHGVMKLPIVHETSGVLFVHKPPGLSFHAGPGLSGLGGEDVPDVGVMTLLRAMQSSGEIEHTGRLHSVHRLDRVTSGLLMVAKSPAAARDLNALLRERRIHKY